MQASRLSAIVLVAAMSGAAPAAFADRQPAAPPPGEHRDGGDAETQRAPDAGPGPGERRGPGGRPWHHGPGLPFLRGIELSEAQQDRLFAILHAEAPQLREQDKRGHQAHEALRAMFDAGEFDEARAAAHTRALGESIAARELLRVRTAGQAMALLTAEQRAKLKQARDQHPPHN
jgi:Spy/CpxP family protein refolding chaperone